MTQVVHAHRLLHDSTIASTRLQVHQGHLRACWLSSSLPLQKPHSYLESIRGSADRPV